MTQQRRQQQRSSAPQAKPADQGAKPAAAATPPTGTAVATRPNYNTALPVQTLRDELRKMEPQLGAALPSTVRLDPQRFVRLLMTTIQRSPKLRECSARSIFQAAMESAALGLAIEPALGHAYLVPFKGQATLMVGYRGYIALAGRSGKVSAVWAKAVYPRDKFQVIEGTTPAILHEPQPPVKSKQPDGSVAIVEEDAIAYYACIKLLDGTVKFEVLWREDVEKIRLRSPAVRASMPTPWDTDYDEMGKKSAIRRVCKTADLSPEVTRAAMVDEQRELDVDAGGLTLADYELPADVAQAGTAMRRQELAERYTGAAGGGTGESATTGEAGDEKPLTEKELAALDAKDAAEAKAAAGEQGALPVGGREPGAEG